MSLDIDEYGSRRKKIDSSVPSYYIIPILGFYLLLAYLTQLIEDEMPAIVKESDLSRDDWHTFSEESARKYLDTILGDAPRVAGTKYHLNKTYDMKALVDDIADQGVQKVWTDWQIVSGDYFLGSTVPFVNIYVNASNIIAVLEGESGFHQNGTIGSSILVNCHYDSVPFAMGASDNAVFCAVMAETLSKFSQRPTKFKHNIVFLFNGAEENPLQASHGFLKHPWSKGVTSVINLDAAGMNGKPAIFQVSDPRVLAAYQRSVSRPNAQSFGEALFTSGIIPSDTDFRVFRDFGHIYGIDIAFVKWATVYHTRYDTAELIRPGVIQNAGNMLTNVLIELADLDDMRYKATPTESVYCDYLNLFMISYSLTISYVVDTVVVLCAILSIAYYLWSVGYNKSIFIEFCYAILGRIVSTLGGVLLIAILTLFSVATTIQLRYLSQPWIVAPMYWVPFFIGATASSQLYDKWRCKKVTLPRSTRVLQASAASRFILSIVAIVTMFTPIPTYVTTVILTFMTLVSVIITSVVRRLTGWQHLLLAVILSVPAVMFVYSLVLRMDAIMLPIMGRSPQNTPDYLVAALNVALAIAFSCILSGYELLFSRFRLWIYLFATLCVCIVISVIPLAPYNDDGPSTMRHYWYHTEIVTYDANQQPIEKSTGVVISKLDGNFLRVKRDIPQAESRDMHCDTRLYCDLPVYRTSFVRPLPEALRVNMSGPQQFDPPASLTADRECTQNNCTYTFHMTGSLHNTITLFPLAEVSVLSWSLDAPVAESAHAHGRPVYILVHSHATYADRVDWHFTVDVHAPEEMISSSSPLIEVSHHSHKIHHPQDFTAEYVALIQSAPKYYNIATFLSFRHNYVF